MAFKDVMRKFAGKDEQFAAMQKEDRLQTKLVERKKNSNERELERFQEEARQDQIKVDLEGFRKERREELFKTTMFDGPNHFTNQKNIFKGTAQDKQRSNLQMGTSMMSRGNMFFK